MHPWQRLTIVVTGGLVLFAVGSLCAQEQKPSAPPPDASSTGPAAPSAEHADAPKPAHEKESPLLLRDIAKMRQNRVPLNQIVEQAGERGVGFELTAAIQNQLRRMGFRPEHIAAFKEASETAAKSAKEAPATEKPGPRLAPGQALRTSESQRLQDLEDIRKIVRLSGVFVQPVECQHVTLWTPKEIQAPFVQDIKKLETFLETRCKEPIRSGLDRRSAHIIVLRNRYEYEKWVQVMFEVVGDPYPDNEAMNLQFKASVAKGFGYVPQRFGVFCLEGQQMEWIRRVVATGIGYMYFTQLVESQQIAPLATGFANGLESVLAGTPSVMLFSSSYHDENRNLGADNRNWMRMVQQRIAAKQVTAVEDLLQLDTSRMTLPHYAEAWTLVGFLAKQPGKFGELILALRENKEVVREIERIYGWDEKTLTEEWHRHVLAQR